MMTRKISRREALLHTGLLPGAALALRGAHGAESANAPAAASSFRFCLNTATLRGHKLGIVKELETAAQAGFQGVEPWVESVQKYVEAGGNTGELKKRIADLGLTIEGAIGFPEWVVDDDERRAKGMERAKREMDLMAQIGAKRFAAPPAGATNLPKLDLLNAAERYRALLKTGDELGIVPELEVWGFSKNLNRLSECAAVAIETGHPKACVLPDIFHLYKGGSDYHGLSLLGPGVVQVLHMNDYPNDPPRDKIDDSYRVYPGDGTAPITDILRTLRNSGGPKVLSLEVFNRGYWAQDPLEVAKTGLAKLKAAVDKVLSS